MKAWAPILVSALGLACSSATPNTRAAVDAGADAHVGGGDSGANLDGAVSPGGDLAGSPGDGGSVDSGPVLIGPSTYTFSLDAGAFPPSKSHPSVLVYVPSGFDPTPPLSIIVYIHGFNNCVSNIIRAAGTSCDADAGLPVSDSYALAAQLEMAHKNALLICPEVAFDQATSAAGTLANAGGFTKLLDETLADMRPVLGPRTHADIDKVVLASHSGGDVVAADIATVGGVPVDEIHLLDSLYQDTAQFESFIKSDLPDIVVRKHRFASVYTCCSSGPEANTQAMIPTVEGYFTGYPGDAGIVEDDRTSSTWPLTTYQHGVLFKFSGLSHNDVPRYYFGKLVQTSVLPDKR